MNGPHKTCRNCNGKRAVPTARKDANGKPIMRTCPACKGTGRGYGTK